MNAMRIVEKPHIKSLSGLDLETSSVPLSSIPPNTHTPLKHIKERWHQSLSLRGPSRIIPNTSALSTTLQSTLVPGSAGPPDFSDISAVGSRFERQGTEPDAAREAMPRQKTWKNPLRPWNPNGFMGVFFTNQEKGVPISKLLNFKPLPSSAISNAANGASEQETTLGQKRMLKLQDKLSAVNDSLRRSGSLSVFEDDVGHVGDEMPQEIQRIATAAKAQSPKLAKRRLPGEDQADPQPEKRRTRHDPLDDLYELALTSPNIHIPRKKRAPQVTLKDNPPKQDNHPTQQDKFVLSEWFVKGVENKGVCVEGKRVDCEDLYWHSNIIVHRIEPYKVQSLTGRVYELKGHVDKACMLEAGCPSWLVGKFKLGFPDNWKSYVNSFLKSPIMPNQPKDPPSKDHNNVTKDAKKATSCSNTKGKQPSNSNKGTHKISCRELKLLRMQDPEHPDGEHGSKDRPSHGNPSTQCGTTRSGRQVKPILKYWCGERISVDFELNTKVIRPDKDTRADSIDRVRGSISGRSHGKGSSSKSPSSKRKMQNKEELPVKKTNSKSQTLRTGQRNVKRSPLKPMSVRLSPLNNRQQMKKRCLQHRVRCRSLSHSNSPPKVSLRKTDMGYKKSQADKTENNKATSSFPQDTDKCETGTLTERRSSSDILIISDDESDDCLPFTKKKGNKSKKALEIQPESFKTSVQPTVHPTEPQNCVRSSERLKRKNSWSKGHVIEMQKETLCDQFPSTKLPSGSPVFLTNITEASEDGRLTGSKGPPHLQTKVNSDLSNTSRTQTLGTEQPITDSGKPPDLENVAVLCENTSKQTVRKKHKATLQKSSKQKTKHVKPYSSKLQSSLTESQDSEEEAKAKVSRQVPDGQKKSTLSKPTRERNPVVESSHSEDGSLTGSKGPPHLQTKVNSELSNTSRTQTLGTEQPITDSGKPPDLENVAVLCENTSKQTVRKKHKATLQKSSKQKTKHVKPYSSKLQSSLTESQDSEEEAKAKVSRQVADSQKSTLSKPTRERNPVVESSLSEVSSLLNSVPGKQRPLNFKKDNKQASHYTQPLDDLEKESSQNKALEEPCDKVAVPSGKSKSSSDLEESEVETVSRKDLDKKVKSKNKGLLSTPGPQKRQNTNSQKSQEQAIEQENAEKRFTGKKIATKRSHSRACQRKTNLSEETSESELDFAEEDDQEDYKSERKARGKATKPSNQLRNLRKRRQILSSSSASEKLDRKSKNDLDSESEEMVPGKDLRQSAKSKNKLLVSTPGPQKIRSQKSQRRAKEKENTEKHFTEINGTNKQTNRSSRKKKSSPSETSPSELDVAGEEEEEKSEEDCKPKRKTKTKVGSKATKPSPLQDLQKPQQNLKDNNASRPSTHSNPEGQLPKNPFAVHQEDGTEKEVKRLCRKSQNDDLNSESEEEVVPGKHLRQSAKSKNKLLVSTPGPQKRRNTRSQKSQRRAIEQENTEKHFTEINDTNKPTNRSSRKKKSSRSETSPSELDVADEEEKSEEDCEPKRKTKTKVSRRATKPSPLQDLQKPQHNLKDDNASRPSTHSNPERQLPKNPFAVHQEDWTEKEVKRLYSAIYTLPKYKRGFWNDVAMAVGNRSAEECQEKYMDNQQFKGSKSKPKKKNCPSKKKKENKGKDMVQITAKVGTLKRKRQMREFLDQMQKDDHDDLFSSTPFRNKRVRLPSMMHNTEDDNFHLDAQSPSSSSGIFPLAYTPESNHISPGMLGTINRSDNEKYVYRLQKSLKHPQFRVFINKKTGHKIQATPTSRRLTTLGKGSRDTSVIAKLFEPNESNNSDEEEKDYYFSNSFSDEN